MARISAIGLTADRVRDVADQNEGLRLLERVQECGRRVRDDQHVAFLDLLEAADGRAVEADAFGEAVEIEGGRRHREMLPQTWEIREAQVDHDNVVVLDGLQDLGLAFRDGKPSVSSPFAPGLVTGAPARSSGSQSPLKEPCRACSLSRANSASLRWISVAWSPASK